jgi:hypothetical protein
MLSSIVPVDEVVKSWADGQFASRAVVSVLAYSAFLTTFTATLLVGVLAEQDSRDQAKKKPD